MKHLLFKLLNFYLYSSLHIGFAAVALCYQTGLLLDFKIPFEYYIFSFSSTIFLYNLHRIIGLSKLKTEPTDGRFKIIKEYSQHIQLYALLGLGSSVFFFFQLDRQVQLMMLIAAAISLLYALPVLRNAKRLRDLPLIKIFAIAAVWSFVTMMIPFIYWSENLPVVIWLVAVERALFICAITIPFDVRDLTIDERAGLETLPSKLGETQALKLGVVLIVACMILCIILWKTGVYTLVESTILLIFYLTTSVLIVRSTKERNDYYYTGLMDGLMILSPLLLLIGSLIF